MKVLLLSLLCCGIFVKIAHSKPDKLKVVYEWKYIDFLFESEAQRREAIECGSYNYTKSVIIDTDMDFSGRTFVSIIRDKGVPASLTTVSNVAGPGGPLLKPYPDWSYYNNRNCRQHHITSVYRVAIVCNKLFVLDTGKIDEDKVCPPQILIFDLATDKLVKKISIPSSVATNKQGVGLLVTPAVYQTDCGNKEEDIFMADIEGYGLVVFDSHRNQFTRKTSPTFAVNPNHTHFTINGESFNLQDGVIGLTIINKNEPELWYSVLTSRNIFKTSIKNLLRPEDNRGSQYHTFKDVLPSQSTLVASSWKGTLFVGLAEETAIACFDTSREIVSSNMGIVAQDSEKLQFISGLKVKYNLKGQEDIYAVSNRLQKVYAGTINYSEINFRILKGNVEQLIRGTRCAEH